MSETKLSSGKWLSEYDAERLEQIFDTGTFAPHEMEHFKGRDAYPEYFSTWPFRATVAPNGAYPYVGKRYCLKLRTSYGINETHIADVGTYHTRQEARAVAISMMLEQLEQALADLHAALDN